MTPEQSFALGMLAGISLRFAEESKKADYSALSKSSEEWSEWRNKARERGVTDDLVTEHCRMALKTGLTK